MEAPSEQLYTLKEYAENHHAFREHNASIICVAVLPNGNVISGSEDKTLKVWDIHTGQCLNTLQGHEDYVSCVAVLPNGNVISGSRDETLKIWNIHTDQCLNTLRGNCSGINCVAILPNGNVISGSGVYEQTLKVWDIHTGQCVTTLRGHKGSVWDVAVLPNGNVISGSFDKTLKVWDIHTGQCVTTLQAHYVTTENSYGRDGITCVAVLPNGNVISNGLNENTLKVWNIHTGQCVTALRGHKGSVWDVAVLPNGNVISGSFDKTLKVWDIHTGQCLNTLEGHRSLVYCVAVLPNGNIISGSGPGDSTLKVWINNGLQSEYQIRKAARILAQGYRDRNCLFSRLPADVCYKIAGSAGSSTIHSKEQAAEIAKRYFCKPQCDELEEKKRKRKGSKHENEKSIKKFI